MKLRKIFDIGLQYGIEQDPRGKQGVDAQLKRLAESYGELNESDRESFDKEHLTNPYADSGILYGDPDTDIKSMMVGIDIGVSEIVLADRLREKRGSLDLVMTHHPEGRCLAKFHNVMYMQADILHKFGVPINIGEALIEERAKEVERAVMPINHTRTVDSAKLLDIPFMGLHTPADNCVVSFLQNLIEEKSPRVMRDIIKILEEIPEYKHAKDNNTAPKIICGSGNRRVGKVFVDMTGGTEGSKQNYAKLAVSGVGTIIGMHMSKEHIKEAEKNSINVIIAGHISSDNIGLNLILDKITQNADMEIIPCSGFYRVKR
ncbi:NGG1p interacting factor NIF3 [bacterium]|nr:NGG1p interacting factor NIF3 [bacterium]